MHPILLPVTALYAGLLGVVFVVLGMSIGGLRLKLDASIATNTTPRLFEAVRRFGNFAEWVPFILLLMALAELNGLRPFYLHLIGGALIIARVAHPFGIRHDLIAHPARFVGASLTFLVTLVLSGILIWQVSAG